MFLILATLLQSLYSTLDPLSIKQSLAFYELYPDTVEGQQALQRVNKLLKVESDFPSDLLTHALNRFSQNVILSEEELALIEKLASHLPNRKLLGFTATSEKEILALDSEQIDLGRALLLSQLDGKADLLSHVRAYTAKLDLMALEVLARLSQEASPLEKIKVLNHYIFEENRFRFPPHSIYAKEIDLYTFLPSVLDNHLGVCLGVAALYLSIAERIDLPLEIVTPPGHIYLRYREGEKIINIETTARGIDIPDEHYLGVNTRKLKLRTRKEVIGMTHVNNASTYLHEENFASALTAYQKAFPYMSEDLMVQELLGYTLIFSEKKEEGKRLIEKVARVVPDEAIAAENMAEDYLAGRTNEEGLCAVFMQVDERRESILKKQKRLRDSLEKYPSFRAGIEQLSVTYLQLNRYKEALHWLKKYHELDQKNPTVEYYLAVLHGERKDYPASWHYLKNAEALVKARDFYPQALEELRKQLLRCSPEIGSDL